MSVRNRITLVMVIIYVFAFACFFLSLSITDGLLISALLFFAVGVAFAYGFSSFASNRFRRVTEQNRTLAKQCADIAKQADDIREENERTKLLLNSTPLACHLWRKNLELIDFNEETLHLHNLRDRQAYMDHINQLTPEYQPDGSHSRQKKITLVHRAFAEGKVSTEWMYLTSDGEPIPVELTLVRVNLGGEDVVAGYARDLRQQIESVKEIERRDELLGTVNRAAEILLTIEDDTNIDAALNSSMEVIGRSLDIDRLQIWRSETLGGEQSYALAYEWLSAYGREITPAQEGQTLSLRDKPIWERMFQRGEHINSPLFLMSQEDQDFLDPLKLKTIAVIPLFLQDHLWGLFTLDDCRQARTFTEDEMTNLQSVSLMMANAINRSELIAETREAHRRTTLLLDSMPLAYRLWNRALETLDYNEEALKLFGVKDGSELNKNLYYNFSIVDDQEGSMSREKADEYMRKAFVDGRCTFEWIYQGTDGMPIPIEATLVRVPYGDDYAVAVYSRDLRAAKKMMREIEQRDTMLSTVNSVASILLRSSPEEFEASLYRCLSMVSEAVNVTRVYIAKNCVINGKLYSQRAYEWWKDVNQQPNRPVAYISYEDQIPGWEEILSTGDSINSAFRDLPPPLQALLAPYEVLAVYVVPIFIKDQFWGYVGYDRCDDERVFSENEQMILRSGGTIIANALQQYDMRANLHASALQLEAALKEAQRANDAKSTFLANMSHDMRTPLNAIIGLSGLSMENDSLDEEAQSNLEKIYNAGATLLSLVNEILDISKIEAGKFELIEVDYDVPSLINDVITQNILHIGEKPIEFHLDIGKGLYAYLRGDELRIKEVMNNLLSNAFKYTQEGAVTLVLACDREGDNVWLTVTVRDTGRGIRPEDINRLFADYTQLDLEANRRVGGTGLGLAISKKLADLMDGDITVNSEYGKGSVFTARFRQKFVSDVRIGFEVVESLKNLRFTDRKRIQNMRLQRIHLPYAKVLVVDDNLTNLDVARGLMKPYAMQVDCVASGQEAVDAIRAEKVKYNAVFMDQMMPKMDGLEATRRIREIGTVYAQTIPVIALTANAITGSEQMFLEKGFQAFLSKPIDIAHLDEVIRHWVRDKDHEHLETSGAPPLANETEKQRPRPQIEIPGLNAGKGVKRFGGDEAMYLEILRSYMVNTRPLLEAIADVREDTLTGYAVVVHGIKGSSRGIYADVIGDFAEALENAAVSKKFGFVSANNASFIESIEKLINDIGDTLKRIDGEKKMPKKESPDPELLKRMVTACETYDMDGLDAAIAELEAYEYSAGNELTEWLKASVSKGEFDDIKERLAALV